ncbi:MAG TPA: FlgD immunoglobulin-like domain containing protein, partial [Candidatus Cloacimonadota bacterium]|nr:FlgD immunoglobulin-like domain containing protein [Candidatus Cloacimonadota bacterium]
LNWITQSETGVLGYRIYRATEPDLSAAEQISPLISASNTSTQQCYVFTDTELSQEGTYYYWLENADLDGANQFHGPISLYYSINGGGQDPSPVLFDGLGKIYPNPFNPTTCINYGLCQKGEIGISIYNLRGQLVRSLLHETKEAGLYKAIWDGKADDGRPCGSGIYLVRMQQNSTCSQQKIMLLK